MAISTLVAKRSARAILLTANGELLMIKRSKPGQAPYWTAPGGGVEDADKSVEASLHRELAEELGARATGASQVFLVSTRSDAGVSVQHIFVARLLKEFILANREALLSEVTAPGGP
jgi:ADP-ribose pyrophosphatase YjhB (NUDIX family)